MRVALACCPAWSVHFPPYNISLLKAVLKQHGHEVKTFDFNIEAWHLLKDGDMDYWEGQNYFYWEGRSFDEFIFPKVDSLINSSVDSVLEYDPDFIGFTVYTASLKFTSYMSQRIREKDSSKKIMIGGPQCFPMGNNPCYLNMADHIIIGEGEAAILEVLKHPYIKAISSPKLTKVNELPVPDYEDYDLTKYKREYGISLETSRGCVNKCSFCTETHYWVYRSKKAETVINEIKECKERYGATHFRFNDSLVNGNIKEFQRLVDILCEEKLGITWDGYARVSKKMDLEFMEKIRDSGNTFISYGIESGSQKVLDGMRKRIKIEDAEQNLKDGDEVGLYNHVNWIIGFPSEDIIDFLYSLIFVHNNKDGIHNIAPGMTCGIGDKAELQTHGERFDILPQSYWSNFVTKDFKNTAIHRFIRLKVFHIWLEFLEIVNGHHHENLKDHYSIKFLNKKRIKDRIEYEDCVDFSYLNEGTFRSSLYAEYVTFFWAVYKVFGPFDITLLFDKDMDIDEFGKIAKEYNSLARFHVDENGKWKLKLVHSLETVKPFDEAVILGGNYETI